jgi:hypothetical protein
LRPAFFKVTYSERRSTMSSRALISSTAPINPYACHIDQFF